MKHHEIREDLLHYIWKLGLFKQLNLETTEGEKIAILDKGIHNSDSGPDFSQARIKIGNTEWAGNVEIHIQSSDWHAHKHSPNPHYKNVILHVVYSHNKEVICANKRPLPTLELKHRIPIDLLEKYKRFHTQSTWIPCENLIGKIDIEKSLLFYPRLAIRRIKRKAESIKKLLENCNGNWETTLFISIAKYLVSANNRDNMQRCIKSLPLTKLYALRDNVDKIEAVLLGQAGLLPEDGDQKSKKYKEEYAYFCKKYSLSKPNLLWHHLRMRPSAFPELRLVQLAAIIHKNYQLFDHILTAESLDDIKELFSVCASSYWDDKHRFGNSGKIKRKKIGDQTIDKILINAVIPIVFLYGIKTDDQRYKDKAMTLLNQIKPENNSILKNWKSIGLKSKTALDSQALLELKTNYCDKQKCLSCQIGHQIMKEPISIYDSAASKMA